MVGDAYEIQYVAKEAGTMELHLWAIPLAADESNVAVRVPLPGSPFAVHVSEGSATAAGSSVALTASGKHGFVA